MNHDVCVHTCYMATTVYCERRSLKIQHCRICCMKPIQPHHTLMSSMEFFMEEEERRNTTLWNVLHESYTASSDLT